MPKSKRVSTPSRTDWAKVDATTDEDIARQIAEDPDTVPELDDEWFDRAKVWEGDRYLGRGKDVRAGRMGRPPGSGTEEQVTLRLDHKILDHFRAGGPGWQTRLNNTLLAAVTARSSLIRQLIEEMEEQGEPQRKEVRSALTKVAPPPTTRLARNRRVPRLGAQPTC